MATTASSRLALRTQLTSLIPAMTTPVVLGPMAGASGGALAARVSKANGLGFIGAGYYDVPTLERELATVYKILGKPPPGSGNRLHLGIGLLAWKLTAQNGGSAPIQGASDLSMDSPALQIIDAAIRAKPRAIWLSFGDDIVQWSRVVREREAALNGGGEAKWGTELKLFVMIGLASETKRAVEDCGADVLVVQGNEAGGHGLGASPPLMTVLPETLRLLPSLKALNPAGAMPPVIGAGGLSIGSHLAALTALGAAGAVYGTRFLLTPEAQYTDEQKRILSAATGADTLRTMAFDEARGTTDWPKGVDGRGIRNATVEDAFKGIGDASARRTRYAQAAKEKDTSRIVTWSGTGVGLVDKIKPAEEVVEEITKDAIEALRTAHRAVDGSWKL